MPDSTALKGDRCGTAVAGPRSVTMSFARTDALSARIFCRGVGIIRHGICALNYSSKAIS
jgi:hypothetical protein